MTRPCLTAALTACLGTQCGGEGPTERAPSAGSQAVAQEPGPEAPVDSPLEAPAAEAVEGFVLLPGGTEVFSGHDSESPVASLPSDQPSLAFAAVSVVGERLLIRSLDVPESASHCASPWFEADGLALEAWVDRSKVMAVTTQEVTVRFDGGATVRMPPGVALAPVAGDANRYRASTDFVPKLLVEVPKDSVGKFYKPGMLSTPDAVAGLLPSTASLSVGPQTFRVADLGSREVLRSEPSGHKAKVLVGDRCLELEATSDAKPITLEAVARKRAKELARLAGPISVLDQRALSDVFRPPGPFSVAQGSALTWRNGDSAGVVRTTSINPSELTVDGDRRCFALRGLDLCTVAENVQELDPTSVFAGKSPPEPIEEPTDAQAVQRTLRSNAGRVRFCYERELKKTPDLKGTVAVRLTVDPDGSVSTVQIDENTTNNASVTRCMRKTLKQMQFPELETEAELSQSFVFTTAG